MKKNEVIGIIGGAGVAATNKLNELIENIFTLNGAFRDMHHPEIIIYQATKAPSRSMYLEGKGESFISDYIKIGKKLKSAGATTLCMSCNTAHYAIDEIQNEVGLPFINLIEEVVSEIKNTNQKKIGLIASDGCLMGKVYEKYFDKIYPEAKIIYPDKIFQQEVTRGICNIKNINRFKEDSSLDRPKNIFTNVSKHLIKKNADIILIGCTDIRVDYFNQNSVDSLEVLAKKIYQKTYEK
ncbi:MAG: amino acid racemase [Candidatus Shapirobacteria bacterium]|jgi:aspartate racemase